MQIETISAGLCHICQRHGVPVVKLERRLCRPNHTEDFFLFLLCASCLSDLHLGLVRYACSGDPVDATPLASAPTPLLTAMLSSAPGDGGVRFAVSSDLIRAMFLDEVEALKDNMLMYGPGRESRVRVLNWLAAQIVPNQQLELTPAQLDQLSRLTDNNSKDNSHLYSLVRAMARLAEKKDPT
jgi:hypothetical protein